MYDNTEVSHTLQHCALAYFPCRRSLLCHMPVLQMYFVLRVFKNRWQARLWRLQPTIPLRLMMVLSVVGDGLLGAKSTSRHMPVHVWSNVTRTQMEVRKRNEGVIPYKSQGERSCSRFLIPRHRAVLGILHRPQHRLSSCKRQHASSLSQVPQHLNSLLLKGKNAVIEGDIWSMIWNRTWGLKVHSGGKKHTKSPEAFQRKL